MKTCNYCIEEIHQDAKTCKHCGRHQKRIRNFFYILSDSAKLLTIGLFLISILQYSDSRKDSNAAKDALDTALTVRRKTEILFNRVKSLNTDLDSMVKLINQTTLLSTQNAWIHANNPIMGLNTNKQSVKQFEKNSNELIRLLIPDSISRTQWWEETERIIHHKK